MNCDVTTVSVSAIHRPRPVSFIVRKPFWQVLSLCALMAFAAPCWTEACEGSLTLSADAEGDDVRFSWDGLLAPGESFVLYTFDLAALPSGPPEAIGTAIYTGTATDFLHEELAGAGHQLTCEDSGGVVSARSNMAFRLPYRFSRTFNEVEDHPRNFERSLVSLPLVSGMRDIDGGGLDAPCAGPDDGRFTPLDLICEFWRPGAVGTGSLAAEVLDISSETWLGAVGFRRDSDEARVLGAAPDLEASPLGGRAAVVRLEGEVSDHSGFLVGAHDPGFAGVSIQPDEDGTEIHYLSLPYHTKYTTAMEVACGLRDVDWVDADGDGSPDTCEGGLFRPTDSPGFSTCQIAVWAPPFEGGPGRSIVVHGPGVFGELIFAGSDFELRPGEGLGVTLQGECENVVFLPPHY